LAKSEAADELLRAGEGKRGTGSLGFVPASFPGATLFPPAFNAPHHRSERGNRRNFKASSELFRQGKMDGGENPLLVAQRTATVKNVDRTNPADRPRQGKGVISKACS
jgi:hypothetical protein